MRGICLAVVCAAMATIAQGDDISPSDVCSIYGDSAALIMQARQDGVTYLDAKAQFGRAGNADLERMIDYAFDRPRMPTARLAAIEVQEMQSAVEKSCLDMAAP